MLEDDKLLPFLNINWENVDVLALKRLTAFDSYHEVHVCFVACVGVNN